MIRAPRQVSLRHRHGKAFGVAVLAVAALAVLGFAAYKYLFDRPGEAAAALIASDADVVITLDTNPSERQIATFKEITDALDREGIAQKLDETITQFLSGLPVGREIRPHLKRSFATGIWMKDGQPGDSVTLCAIDDPAAVRASLERHGEKKADGVYALKGAPGSTVASVVEGYIAISNSEAALSRIERVRSGAETPISKLEAYVEARQALPDDANLMVFLSPRVFQELQKHARGMSGMEAMKTTKWMAYSATVVPEGIAFDYQCPMDATKMEALKRMGSIAEFNLDVLKMLPEGAYGVFGYSQSGKYWETIQDSFEDAKEVKQTFDDGIAKFEKETGLSIQGDLVPALQGEQIVAVYPGLSGKPEDLDIVAVLTDSNGANPAALAAKLRELVIRKAAEEKVEVRFEESKIGDHSVWQIDAAGQKELTTGVSKLSPFPTSRPRMNELPPMPPEMKESPEMKKFYEDYEARRKEMETAQKANPTPSFLDGKTLVYAQVGNSVVAASRREVLERALAADGAGKSLANDPAIVAMKPQVVPGSQCILFVNLHRIMKALEPTMNKNMSGSPIRAADLAALFGDGLVGLVASGKFDGQTATGRLLLPLNFDRGISLIGDAMNAPNSRRDMRALPTR